MEGMCLPGKELKMTKDKGASGFDQGQYGAEVKERWGETDAFVQAAIEANARRAEENS